MQYNYLDDFAIFIISKGETEIKTYDILRIGGYTGKIIIVANSRDSYCSIYKNMYKGDVETYNLQDYIDNIDTLNNFYETTLDIYARNFCVDKANELGLRYFCILDSRIDRIRHCVMSGDKRLDIDHLDTVFNSYIKFLEDTGISAVGLQNILACDNSNYSEIVEECIIYKNDKEWKFNGNVNNDFVLNAQNFDRVMITPNLVGFIKSEENIKHNRSYYYIINFYNKMVCPSSVTLIKDLGGIFSNIDTDSMFPKIIKNKFKK